MIPEHNLLVATDVVDDRSLRNLSRYAKVHKISDLDEKGLAELAPSIDSLLIFSWPSLLNRENLQRMSGLRFVQSILAGVNHVPFADLNKTVIVSSNAGAYSDEVAEYVWALLLSSTKRVVEFHNSIKEEKWNLRRTLDSGREVMILKDKTLGILGYGGIGQAVARMARGFGMRIFAYSRHSRQVRGVTFFQGQSDLSRLLGESDCVVLCLPLTHQTTRIMDERRLSEMKKTSVLVNIARGELVDEKAVYDHMLANSNFRYATDVWWYREGRESLKTDYPFLSLPNFVGTPHVSGPSGLATGRPVSMAVENTIRFLKGLKPRNVVNPSEYLAQGPQPY